MEMGAGVLVDSIREVRWINCERTCDISAGWRTVVVYPDEDCSTARISEGSDAFDDFEPLAASATSNFDLKSSSAASAVRANKVLNSSSLGMWGDP
jgi:hypothetical protein